MKIAEIKNAIKACENRPYTESQFYALPFDLRDGVERFWEPGYDYTDPDFWTSYPDVDAEFIEATVRYDLMQKENA